MATPKVKEHVEEFYYAMLPASGNESGTGDLYFWFSNTARRGMPSDYGWSTRPEDVIHGYATKEILLDFLHTTLALDIDRGTWSMAEATAVQIFKVTEKTVTTTEVELDPSIKSKSRNPKSPRSASASTAGTATRRPRHALAAAKKAFRTEIVHTADMISTSEKVQSSTGLFS